MFYQHPRKGAIFFANKNESECVLVSRAIVGASQPNQLIKKDDPKISEESLRETIAKQEREIAALQVNIKVIEESFGENTLLLTVTKAYLKKLLTNAKLVLWLSQNHPEYLAEFQSIAEISSLSSIEDSRTAA
jgi:hypothetical protein